MVGPKLPKSFSANSVDPTIAPPVAQVIVAVAVVSYSSAVSSTISKRLTPLRSTAPALASIVFPV